MLFFIAVMMGQRCQDKVALGVGKWHTNRHFQLAAVCGRVLLFPTGLWLYHVEHVIGQNIGAMHGIFQLAHIARPIVVGKYLERFLRELLLFAFGNVEVFQKNIGEKFDVILAFAQWRHPERYHSKPISRSSRNAPSAMAA